MLTPTDMPLVVLTAAVAVALALPVFGWAVLSRPAPAVVQARENLTRGIGGPQDPDVLHDPELLAGAVPGWGISRLERIDRDTDPGTAVDTLLFAQRP